MVNWERFSSQRIDTLADAISVVVALVASKEGCLSITRESIEDLSRRHNLHVHQDIITEHIYFTLSTRPELRPKLLNDWRSVFRGQPE